MRYPDLEIDLLRAFTTVAETGSFTAAADVVGRSQSAVSQKIIRLEELLGRPLFNRTSRSLVLTGEGERLLSAARRMLEFNDMAVRTLVAPADVGRLRIGISEDFVPHHLPALLAKFAALWPAVRLELMTGLSCDLLSAYDDDRLDVVIAKKDGRAQRGRVIWREPLVWIGSAGYDHQSLEPVPLVLLPTPCTYRGVAIRALEFDQARLGRGVHGEQPERRARGGGRRFRRHGARTLLRPGRGADHSSLRPVAGAANDGDRGDRGGDDGSTHRATPAVVPHRNPVSRQCNRGFARLSGVLERLFLELL